MIQKVSQGGVGGICPNSSNNGPIAASFFGYFRPFLITISIIQIEKRVDGVLGIPTRGRMMVGTDDTTELWRPSIFVQILITKSIYAQL